MDFRPNWPKVIGSVILGFLVEYTFEMYLMLDREGSAGYREIIPPNYLWFAYLVLMVCIYLLWSVFEKNEIKKTKKRRKR
jgi:hypothetical protein